VIPNKTIVDCFGSGEMYLAVVSREGEERVQIETSSGQLKKIAATQILTALEPATPSLNAQMADLQGKIMAAVEEIDGELLWQDWLENGGQPGLTQVAERYFGETTPILLSALARYFIKDTIHFQRQGRDFVPRTAEAAAEMEQLLAKRAARAAFRERCAKWLATVLCTPQDKWPVEIPEEMQVFVRHTVDFLTLGFHSEEIQMLVQVRPRSPVRETAIALLKITGSFPPDADEFLLVNGIHAGFTQDVMEYADSLSAALAAPVPQAAEAEVFSIDDISTREIDDALSAWEQDGHLFVNILLAHPADIIAKGDLLDQAAVDRPLSLYLPTTTVMMFPDRIGCDLSSLNCGVPRSTFAFLVEFDEEGEIADWKLSVGSVTVTRRLTYDEADAILQSPAGTSSDPVAKPLRLLFKQAKNLLTNRQANGGITLNRPEIRVSVKGDEITLTEENQDTPSHILVQEYMVLANHLAAQYALHNDIPIIYRAQDEPAETAHSVCPYNPVLFDREVRKMRRTRLTTFPQSHSGLGLSLYTQVSSPLRRYADLVIQRQLSAHVQKQKPPYTQEELFGVLDNVEKTSFQNRNLEREARRYWIFEYLRRNLLNQEIAATVVKLEGRAIIAEIDKYYERGIILSREHLQIGERCLVRLTEIKPKLTRLVMEYVRPV